MHFESVVQGKLIGPEDVLLANRVHRVDGDGKGRFPLPVQGAFIQVQAGLPLLAGQFRVVGIQEDERHHGPQAHVQGRLPGVRGEPVLVVEGGGAGFDHFQAGRLGAPINEIAVQSGLDFPNIIEPVV